MTARRARRLQLALVAAALVAGAAGVFLALQPGPARKAPGPTQRIMEGAFPTPGAANLAGFRVVVDELQINLPIVEGDGVTVPLYRAAHYPGMKIPGQGGRSLLYAHAQDGMFGNLLLRGAVGEHVEVTRPGQSTLHYVVKSFSKDWAPRDLSILQPADHEELVLLTCTSYDPNTPRVVAVADPVSA